MVILVLIVWLIAFFRPILIYSENINARPDLLRAMRMVRNDNNGIRRLVKFIIIVLQEENS